jgi:hypothetical protein
MKLTAAPVISESKVTEVSLHFGEALSLSEFKKLFETINTILNNSFVQEEHQHTFVKYPIYDGGEMIAVIEKCSCGETRRLNT